MSKSVNLIMGQILSIKSDAYRRASLTIFLDKIPLPEGLMQDIHGHVSLSQDHKLDSIVRDHLECRKSTILKANQLATAGKHSEAARLYNEVHEYGKAADSYTKAGNRIYAETAMDKEFCLAYFENWVSLNTSLILNLIKEGKISEAMELVYP